MQIDYQINSGKKCLIPNSDEDVGHNQKGEMLLCYRHTVKNKVCVAHQILSTPMVC